MATKHDEFKVYYFSFTGEELVTILAALRNSGEDEFAAEIADQVFEDEPESDGTTASLKFDIDFSAVEGATRALECLELAAIDAERAVDSLNRTMGGTVDKGEW